MALLAGHGCGEATNDYEEKQYDQDLKSYTKSHDHVSDRIFEINLT